MPGLQRHRQAPATPDRTVTEMPDYRTIGGDVIHVPEFEPARCHHNNIDWTLCDDTQVFVCCDCHKELTLQQVEAIKNTNKEN